MTLKIEIGKTYVTSSGKKFRVVAKRDAPAGIAEFITLGLPLGSTYSEGIEVPFYHFGDGRSPLNPILNLIKEDKKLVTHTCDVVAVQRPDKTVYFATMDKGRLPTVCLLHATEYKVLSIQTFEVTTEE